MNRRELLKAGLGVAGVAMVAGVATEALSSGCFKTPTQPKGPFYPVDTTLGTDTDLTLADGQTGAATGQVIYVGGSIIDTACAPVSGALVEIWQACSTGKYNHPNDPNTAVLDPNFQYYGKAITDAQGKYLFKTIVPGAYPADVNWMRPAHIHFKVAKTGYYELITQMYFEGDAYNQSDLILQQLSAADQNQVVVTFQNPLVGMDPLSKYCEFNIGIRKVVL